MRTAAFLLIPVCTLLACSRRSVGQSRKAPEGFDQSYPSHNGLITVHYPSSFAAKTTGKAVVVLVRNLLDGTDEAATFTSVDKPISDELSEFARVVDQAETSKLNGYTETAKNSATCNGQKGVETRGKWVTAKSGTPYLHRACHFLRDGHGFSFAYSVPEKHPEEDVLMMKIVEATEFRP
jgi:hypothetical protein